MTTPLSTPSPDGDLDPIRDLDLVRPDDPRVLYFRGWLRAHDRHQTGVARMVHALLRRFGITVAPCAPSTAKGVKRT